MITVFIDGEAGTTGLQIRQRLSARTDLEIISLSAENRKQSRARRDLLNNVDIAILCLPDEAAREALSLLDVQAKTRIIDASSAFRTNPDWVYGFSEMTQDQPQKIAQAKWVSNPGCYPQGFIALIRPLIMAGLMPDNYPLSYNAISGYSGGGRQLIAAYEAIPPQTPAFLPYGLSLEHKHLAEMHSFSKSQQSPIFQPSVGNFFQGLYGVIPVHTSLLKPRTTPKNIWDVLAQTYQDTKCVTLAPLATFERHKDVHPQALNGTNHMKLHVFANEKTGHILLASLYDNLGKGASGSAVQNLNLMIGAPEDLATDLV